MKLFSAEQIRDWDSYTIAHEPIASIQLMDRAASCFCEWFLELFPTAKKVLIVCGLGNNGGDGLAVARLLSAKGMLIQVILVGDQHGASPDFLKQLKTLKELEVVSITHVLNITEVDKPNKDVIIIDALFGTGLNRAIEGIGAQIIDAINSWSNIVTSIDIPSGLQADKASSGSIIEADYCFSFEVPKLACLCPENERYVGKLSIASIQLHPQYAAHTESYFHFFTLKEAKQMLRQRTVFSHKGTNGKALIIAGSTEKMGAALLASKACLVTGAGTVTLQLPRSALSTVNAFCPELMCIADPDESKISICPDVQAYNAVAFGPGCGIDGSTQKAFESLLKSNTSSLVIDADGLNLLAANQYLFKHIKPESILTPHPGEFARLFGQYANSFERWEALRKHAIEKNIIIVLKGAYTAIAFPDGSISFNASGNMALATAGSGDVLSGIICSLLAQGYSPKESALLGVFIHGLGADIYQEEIASQRMIASQIIEHIHLAFERVLSP